MPEPGIVWFGAAVLCAAAAGCCDHRGCHGRGRPYRVLCVGTDNMVGVVHACVYSSLQAAGSWGTTVSVPIGANYVTPSRGTLVGDEMYMALGLRGKILSYNFAKHRLSVIDAPDSYDKGIVLMLTEDGLLGLSGIRGFPPSPVLEEGE